MRNRTIQDWLVFALSVSPLLLTSHLPLSDLPNHLARQFILRDIANSTALRTFYDVDWHIVPNMALEIFVFLARGVVGIETAVRLFCIVTMLLIFVGTRMLACRGGTGSRIYLASPILFYGGPFQYGFLSFCFGVGLALCLFAFYIRRTSSLRHWVLIVLGGGCLLLCHIAAFGIYCAAVGGYEAGTLLDLALGRGIATALRAVPKALGTLVIQTGVPLAALMALSPRASAGIEVRLSNLMEKADGIVAVTLYSAPLIELSILAISGGLLAIALCLRSMTFERRFWGVLASLFLLFVITPRSGFGGGYIDYRLPWAMSFFVLGALRPARILPAFDFAAIGICAAMVCLRVGSIGALWWTWEPQIAAIDTALSTLPIGTRLMVVEGLPASVSESRRPSLLHVAAYAVARRQAFEPSVYAGIAGQVLMFQPKYQARWRLVSPSRLDELPDDYDFVLVLRPRFAAISRSLPLTSIASNADFDLRRISR